MHVLLQELGQQNCVPEPELQVLRRMLVDHPQILPDLLEGKGLLDGGLLQAGVQNISQPGEPGVDSLHSRLETVREAI